MTTLPLPCVNIVSRGDQTCVRSSWRAQQALGLMPEWRRKRTFGLNKVMTSCMKHHMFFVNVEENVAYDLYHGMPIGAQDFYNTNIMCRERISLHHKFNFSLASLMSCIISFCWSGLFWFLLSDLKGKGECCECLRLVRLCSSFCFTSPQRFLCMSSSRGSCLILYDLRREYCKYDREQVGVLCVWLLMSGKQRNRHLSDRYFSFT